jgi:type IV pilus assembly protein PilW
MRAYPQRGFSLVEILVAMVIALAGTVIIFQVFAVSEGIRRTSTSGGDAQQNGLLALFSIERDARMAGVGINFTPALGCIVDAHDDRAPVRDFSFSLVPASITDGAGGVPDSLTVVYGNSSSMRAPPRLTAAVISTSTVFKVDNRFGFNLGELLVVFDQGNTTGKHCTLRQVQRLPDIPRQDEVINDVGDFMDGAGSAATAPNTPTASFNKPNGVGTAYGAWDNLSAGGGRLFNLGLTPTAVTYFIQNGQLWRQNLIVPTTSGPIADGIVQFQVVYGKDTNGDGNVDKWEATMPATPTPADWAQVLALKVAVVARSSLAEKPQVPGGPCDTTTTAPTWFDPSLPGASNFVLSADPNWQCYRYRVFETTVPLRNSFWLQNSN